MLNTPFCPFPPHPQLPPPHSCQCKPGYSGTPGATGEGCVRPSIRTDDANGLLIQVAANQDVTFRIGRDSTITVTGLQSALTNIDALNSDVSAQISNLAVDVANMTARVLSTNATVATQTVTLAAHSSLLAVASSNLAVQSARLSVVTSNVAVGQSIADAAQLQLGTQLPTIQSRTASLGASATAQISSERSTRDGYRSDLVQAQVAAEYLAERTGQLNDSHNAIFQTVSTLLGNQVCWGGKRGMRQRYCAKMH